MGLPSNVLLERLSPGSMEKLLTSEVQGGKGEEDWGGRGGSLRGEGEEERGGRGGGMRGEEEEERGGGGRMGGDMREEGRGRREGMRGDIGPGCDASLSGSVPFPACYPLSPP